MKYFFPRDKKGNPVGFAVPESQVFDTEGARLVDKLGVLKTDLSALSEQVEDMKSEPGGGSHVITNDESVINALPDNSIYYELVSSDSTTEP